MDERNPPRPTVALALREQILEAGQVPAGELDWKVDMIVGPDGIVSAPSSRTPSALATADSAAADVLL